MKHPLVRIATVIFLGLLILIISSSLMITVTSSTNLFKDFPFTEKIFMQTSILVFSLLFIYVISRGNLKLYGFIWNINFPLKKIILISLFSGLASALIEKLTLSEGHIAEESFSFFEQVLYIWIWASICEEIFTRGLIQGYLAPLKNIGINLFKYFISLPVIIGALFFGAMHLMMLAMGMDIIMVLVATVLGTFLGIIAGYYREKTGSLIPAIIVHFCFNVSGTLLSLLVIKS